MVPNDIEKILFSGKKIYGKPYDLGGLLPLYENLLKSFTLDGLRLLPPELVVYSSYNKEIVTKYLLSKPDNTASAYLLFDTHLLDLLGEFTEAFLASRHAESLTQKLTYQLLAEEMYISGKLHESLHFAYQYRASKSMVQFTEERNTAMARHLLVQEAFVLCHELTHWYLFRCDKAERDRYMKFKRDLWVQYLNDLISGRVHKGDAKGIALLSEMKEHIQTCDAIVEEISCDTFAAMYLVEYFSEINGYTKVDIAVSSFLCVQNLQMLSFLEHGLGTSKEGKPQTEWLAFNMTLRMILYKHHISVYFANYAKEIVKQFNDEITQCKETYDERVFSPFIGITNKAQNEIRQLRLLPHVSFLDDDYAAMDTLIRGLLKRAE